MGATVTDQPLEGTQDASDAAEQGCGMGAAVTDQPLEGTQDASDAAEAESAENWDGTAQLMSLEGAAELDGAAVAAEGALEGVSSAAPLESSAALDDPAAALGGAALGGESGVPSQRNSGGDAGAALGGGAVLTKRLTWTSQHLRPPPLASAGHAYGKSQSGGVGYGSPTTTGHHTPGSPIWSGVDVSRFEQPSA